MKRIFIKKCFLFAVRSVCRVKRPSVRDKCFADDEEVETEVRKWLRLLCCGFRRTDKAMVQVYQCWWRICREINVFFQVRILHVLRFIAICDLFTDSRSHCYVPHCRPELKSHAFSRWKLSRVPLYILSCKGCL
jgi:hypothetical protein